jgi:hypothetical protein
MIRGLIQPEANSAFHRAAVIVQLQQSCLFWTKFEYPENAETNDF